MRRVLPLFVGGLGLVDGYRLTLQSRGLARSTIENYIGCAKLFVRWCTSHELDYLNLTRREITFYLGELAEDHSASAVYLTFRCLNYFYEYLIEEGQAEANPVLGVRYKHPQPVDAEPFSQDEMLRMFRACRSFREQAVYLLVAGSGLRRKEVFGIRRADVDFDVGEVTVTGKGDKVRRIRPGALTMAALQNALAFDEELCPFNSVEWVWWTIKGIAQRAGIRGRVYTHRFRHNFATRFLDEGGTVEELAEILGHSSVTMSMRYARAGRRQRALRRMGELDMTRRLLGG